MLRSMEDQCLVDSPVVDSRQSLMLFVPAEDRGQAQEGTVVQGQDPLESCIAPYRLDSVNEKLLHILGTLPFHEGGGRTETRRLQSEDEASEFAESVAEYQLGHQFAGGGFGDIWRAQKRTSSVLFCKKYLTVFVVENNKEETGFVLKRLKSERGEDAFLSGLREAYFGSLFQQEPHEENNHIVIPLSLALNLCFEQLLCFCSCYFLFFVLYVVLCFRCVSWSRLSWNMEMKCGLCFEMKVCLCIR